MLLCALRERLNVFMKVKALWIIKLVVISYSHEILYHIGNLYELTQHAINEPYLPKKNWPRCYAKSLHTVAQDTYEASSAALG